MATASKVLRWRTITTAQTGAPRRFPRYSSTTCSVGPLQIRTATHKVSQRRQADNGWTTIVELIPRRNSQLIGVVQLGSQCLASCSSFEDRLGVVLLPGLPATAWPARHAVDTGLNVMEPHLTSDTRVDLTNGVHGVVRASKEHKFASRTSVGLWLCKSSRGDSHLTADDVVIVRTVKRSQVERVLRLDALSWLLRPPRVKKQLAYGRRRCITWNYIMEDGGILWRKACTVVPTHHNKQCIERFQTIFEREVAEAAATAVARAGADFSMTQGQQASSSSGPVRQWCLLQQLKRRLQVHPSEMGFQHARQNLSPWETWKIRQPYITRGGCGNAP